MIVLCDLIFSALILFGICWCFFISQTMELWQFFIALLLCYTSARYLLFSYLEYYIINSLEVINEEEDE